MIFENFAPLYMNYVCTKCVLCMFYVLCMYSLYMYVIYMYNVHMYVCMYVPCMYYELLSRLTRLFDKISGEKFILIKMEMYGNKILTENLTQIICATIRRVSVEGFLNYVCIYCQALLKPKLQLQLWLYLCI